MGRKCSVCSHEQAEEINQILIARSDSYRTIADRFGLSETALKRHAAEHLPETMTKAAEAAEVAHADNLVAQVRSLQQEVTGVLQEAKAAKDHRLVLSAVDRALKSLDLQARMLGKMQDGPTVNINLNPQWIEIRGVILKTLEPYPEARLKLSEALQDV